MRTLGFRTHLLLTLAACGGIAAALGLSWFGDAPATAQYISGPMDRTLETLGRAISGAGNGRAVGAASGACPVPEAISVTMESPSSSS